MINNCNNSVTIYLAYHKPAIIIENEVLKPIHSGKRISKQDFGMRGDDTGDNISHMGNSLNELTVLYWMWKNDRIHEYLGLCHYRRIFIFNPDLIQKIPKENKKIPFLSDNFERDYGWRTTDILNAIKDTDIIVSRYWNSPIGRTHGEQYIHAHGEESYNFLVNGVKQHAPEYYPYLMKCLNGKNLIIGNMFVMRRDLLNEYCQWLFPLLKKVNPEVGPTTVSSYNIRQGYAAERLFHAYIEKLKVDHPEIKVRQIPFLLIEDTSPEICSLPAIKKEYPVIPIVYIFNDEQIPFFCVQLESLLSVVSPEFFYDLIILSDQLSDENKKILNEQISSHKNLVIRFFNTNHVLRKDKKLDKSQINKGFFVKLNLANILPDYEKILFFTPNIIIREDPSGIFMDDYREFYAGTVISLNIMESRLLKNHLGKPYKQYTFFNYFEKVVGLSKNNIECYFNSEIMVMNLKKMRNDKLEEAFLSMYYEKKYYFKDQDVFNRLFNGNVKNLSQRWNVTNLDNKEPLPILPFFYEQEYLKALEDPAIIHYKTEKNLPLFDGSGIKIETFWKFARLSPFYEIILKEYITHTKSPKIAIKMRIVKKNLKPLTIIIKNKIRKFLSHRFFTR